MKSKIINRHQYITLTFIGISATGLQGMCYVQTMQKHVPQLTQKLNQYRYHIGGALALAGLVYGGYTVWKFMNPYKILCDVRNTNMHGFEYQITISNITCKSKQLSTAEIQGIKWTTGHPRLAINDFVNKCFKHQSLKANQNVVLTYHDHHLCVAPFTPDKAQRIKDKLAELIFNTTSNSGTYPIQ